jgi:hypothetical protein
MCDPLRYFHSTLFSTVEGMSSCNLECYIPYINIGAVKLHSTSPTHTFTS